jgi:hypothetical protein
MDIGIVYCPEIEANIEYQVCPLTTFNLSVEVGVDVCCGRLLWRLAWTFAVEFAVEVAVDVCCGGWCGMLVWDFLWTLRVS